ncbi:hypothetical protein H0W80_00115 [Candidatus Saccharibacteria bacterium]|nr:hypothetical protein [Candidatus Saccharibacteria bacterium]
MNKTEKAKIDSQPETQQMLGKLVELYGIVDCKNLHHNKNKQHESFEDCPVEKEINDIITQLRNIVHFIN